MSVLTKQLQNIIRRIGISSIGRGVLAYEPLWAIGTKLAGTPEKVQEVHKKLRDHLMQLNKEVADNMQILYGGSVTLENSALILKKKDIDGVLVGNASLEAKEFMAIIKQAIG
jgi:triosephosphate isomerase